MTDSLKMGWRMLLHRVLRQEFTFDFDSDETQKFIILLGKQFHKNIHDIVVDDAKFILRTK